MEFAGISASPGIVRGKAFLFLDDKLTVPRHHIEASQVEYEYGRFLSALTKASEEVKSLARGRNAKLFDAQILMFDDPDLKSRVHSALEEKLRNVEWVLLQIIEEASQKLESADSQYLRERTVDFSDAGNRILGHLLFRPKASLADVTSEVILVTHNLMPSDTLGLDRKLVLGIAADVGGKTSHTAILARSSEIPAVLGLSDISRHVKTGDEIIVDGIHGTVIVEPDEATRSQYDERRKEWLRKYTILRELRELPAETIDGKLVSIEANIELPEEADSVLAHGGDGIGLFRSEFLFLQPDGFPSEEDQYRAYSSVLKGMRGRSVTIRTLDLGGDKVMPGFSLETDANPLLGWRAIRFCLSRPEIFRTQLRALLRSSVHGNLRIMFPLISGAEELDPDRGDRGRGEGGPSPGEDPFPRGDAHGDHDRGPLRCRHLRHPRCPGGFFLHRHQRPYPVHPCRRQGEREGGVSLRALSSGRASPHPHDNRERPRERHARWACAERWREIRLRPSFSSAWAWTASPWDPSRSPSSRGSSARSASWRRRRSCEASCPCDPGRRSRRRCGSGWRSGLTSSPGKGGGVIRRGRAKSSLPRVAILGRPNVGKSSLFNALIGRRRSITHSLPGVTRDPVEEPCTLGGVSLLLVDTGGFTPGGEALDRVVSERSIAAARASDLAILVLDAGETTPEDEDFMDRLRPLSDRLLLVVNKVDTPDKDPAVWNAHSHGFPRVIGVSAAHGRNLPELKELIASLLEGRAAKEGTPADELADRADDSSDQAPDRIVRIAILGKPNTGKSSLANRLTGDERSIVSSTPGTTRDVVQNRFEYRGRVFELLDTAGHQAQEPRDG